MTPVVRNRLFALGTLIVVAYLAVMAYVCSDLRGRRLCNGIEIVVVDSLEQKFVTVAELRNELGRLPSIAEKTPLDRINTDSLQRMLSVIDKIENAGLHCNLTSAPSTSIVLTKTCSRFR